MNDTYTPPKVWTWDQGSGGKFANINRPIAGATSEKDRPVGKHPIQLYSLATPNGVKVTVMLEELLALGHSGAEYDAWLINIGEGDQFTSGFVEANPNSKIPAMMDHSTDTPTRVFESASILLYLAEKFGEFIPTDHKGKTECMNWLFWQMGSAPYTQSTALQWKPNVSLMFSIAISQKTNILRAMNIQSQTWQSGLGMAFWFKAKSMVIPPPS